MLDVTQSTEAATEVNLVVQDKTKLATLPVWETPTIEDVSEQVMAQPYIRFT